MKSTNDEYVTHINYEGGLITDRSTLLNFFKDKINEANENKRSIKLFIERIGETIVYGTVVGCLKKVEQAFQSINGNDLKEIYELIKEELGAKPNKKHSVFSTIVEPTFDINEYVSFQVSSDYVYDVNWYMNEVAGTTRGKTGFHFHVWRV